MKKILNKLFIIASLGLIAAGVIFLCVSIFDRNETTTPLGKIHYWVHLISPDGVTLVFLPGLTADHRLFDKQIVYFEGKYNVLVWDAPGHAASWPRR